MNNKYETALDLMNNIECAIDYDRMCFAWDKLFEFIFDNFEKPKSSAVYNTNEGKAVFLLLKEQKKSLVNGLYKIPPEYAEFLFPVAIARHLLMIGGYLGGRNIPRTKDLKTYNKFYSWYGKMIIKGSTEK